MVSAERDRHKTLPRLRTFLKGLLFASVHGVIFFIFTCQFNYYFIAGRDVLRATVLNMAAVVLFLMVDKWEVYMAARLAEQVEKGDDSPLTRSLLSFFNWGGISAKTGLYWFYVVLLFLMAIVAADPDFAVLNNYRNYFDTVSYGLLILITYDKFLERFIDELRAGKRV